MCLPGLEVAEGSAPRKLPKRRGGAADISGGFSWAGYFCQAAEAGSLHQHSQSFVLKERSDRVPWNVDRPVSIPFQPREGSPQSTQPALLTPADFLEDSSGKKLVRLSNRTLTMRSIPEQDVFPRTALCLCVQGALAVHTVRIH